VSEVQLPALPGTSKGPADHHKVRLSAGNWCFSNNGMLKILTRGNIQEIQFEGKS
jgi:hypothetical protein